MTRSLILAVVLLTASHATADDAIAGRRPNIVFILTDDQGYGDLSCHGNPVLKTPNIDRLHAEGVRFTDFHVSPTCAPTRSALFTGRHEFKNGVTHTILERERLTLTATTLPQVLKAAGYTTGIFGKWHLGDEAEYQPNKRGFDEVFIHGAGGIGQSYPGSCGDVPGNTYFDPTIRHNGTFEKTKGYCTNVFFEQAKRWIAARDGKQPFFCYISTNAPHGPLQVRPADEVRYRDKVKDANVAKFFGMVANIDDNVGRLLDLLKERGLEKDTLVIFMNDNGGTAGVPVYNAGMRGQKVTPWVGGTRASSLWRWPGTLTPADCAALTAHVDFFRTLSEIAGAKVPEALQAQVEGRSLVPLLRDPTAAWDDRVLFTHAGRWPKGAKVDDHKYAGCGVRDARWHLVRENLKKTAWELFDLTADPGEKTNVAAQHADVVKRLDAAYDAWWASLPPYLVNEGAVGPAENPFRTLYRQQTNGATRWQKQAEDGPADFRGLSAVSDKVAWVGGTKGTVGRTTDGGMTWEFATIPGAEKFDFRDVEAFGPSTAYALSIGPGGDSRIYKTADGGKAWTLQFQNADPDAFYDAIAFWDEKHGLALSDPVKGYYRLVATDDGGTTWKEMPTDKMPPALKGEGAFAASGTCLIAHGETDAWFVTGGGKFARVFHSTDRGRSWTASEAPVAGGTESAGAFSIAFRDHDNGVIVGGDYKKPKESGATVAVTRDGGKTWTAVPNALPFRSGLAWAKDRWIAVGTSGAHASLNGGATWKELDGENYNAVGFAKSGDGWAVGPKGGIARFIRP